MTFFRALAVDKPRWPETRVVNMESGRLTSLLHLTALDLAPPIGEGDITTSPRHGGQHTDSPGLYEPSNTNVNEKNVAIGEIQPYGKEIANHLSRDTVARSHDPRDTAVLSGGAPIKTVAHPSQRQASGASTHRRNSGLTEPHRQQSTVKRLTTGLLTPERKIREVPGYRRSWINIAKSNWLNLLLIFIPISWALHFAVGNKNPTAVFITCFIAVIPLGESSLPEVQH